VASTSAAETLIGQRYERGVRTEVAAALGHCRGPERSQALDVRTGQAVAAVEDPLGFTLDDLVVEVVVVCK
jgi:hypothetical protein